MKETECCIYYKDVSDLFSKLESLEDGWFDGQQGKALKSLKWFIDDFNNKFTEDMPIIFPNIEGGLELVWKFFKGGDVTLTLSVNLRSRKAYFYLVYPRFKSVFWDLDMSLSESWHCLNKVIKAVQSCKDEYELKYEIQKVKNESPFLQ